MADKKKNRNRSFGGVTLMLVMLVAAALLALCYLSAYMNPAKAWFMTFFGLIYFPMFVINLLLLIWALIRRYVYFIIPLIALIPSIFLVGRYFQLGQDDGLAEGELKVLSYNIGKFILSQNDMGQQECLDSVVRFIGKEDPDIICFQEIENFGGMEGKAFLDRTFEGYNKVFFTYSSGRKLYGNVTLTKFPVLDQGIFDFEKSANLAIYCDCQINGERIRIYNCHFQSYSIALSRMVRDLRDDYKETVKTTETKFKNGITMRPKQVDQIMNDILKSPYKSLIAGDFNDTPMSYTYQKLMRYQKDSFKEAGKGCGATYSMLWPILRIDYILYPSVFDAVSHRTPKKVYSDHYPIIATFDYN